MQFIEGGIKKDASSDDEDTEDDEHISVLNEANMRGVESLHVVDQVHLSLVLFFVFNKKNLHSVDVMKKSNLSHKLRS